MVGKDKHSFHVAARRVKPGEKAMSDEAAKKLVEQLRQDSALRSSMPKDSDQPDPKKPGPEEERLKIDMPWEEAVKKSLQKKKPAEGWPDDKPDKPKRD